MRYEKQILVLKDVLLSHITIIKKNTIIKLVDSPVTNKLVYYINYILFESVYIIYQINGKHYTTDLYQLYEYKII